MYQVTLDARCSRLYMIGGCMEYIDPMLITYGLNFHLYWMIIVIHLIYNYVR